MQKVIGGGEKVVHKCVHLRNFWRTQKNWYARGTLRTLFVHLFLIIFQTIKVDWKFYIDLQNM